MPEIWRRLEAVGLGTTEACGDVPRVVLGSPVAGIAADELIDPTPQIDEITSRFIGDESLANLPRKFKSAITGHPSQDVVHEINDVAFVAVEHPELGIGYDLWVGGGLSTAPRLGERLGAFVAPEQVADAWHGVAQIFRDYGYRRLRNKARLKFLLAEWGTEKFRQVLQDEYLGYALPDGPAAPKPLDARRPRRRAPAEGRPLLRRRHARSSAASPGPTLAKLADLIEAHGSTAPAHDPAPEARHPRHPRGPRRVAHRRPRRARPLRRVRASSAAARSRAPASSSASSRSSRPRRTRRPPCSTSRSVSRSSTCRIRSRLHVNGCPNSCARIQTADIGLKGQLVTIDGEQVPGYQVHLGGGLAIAATATRPASAAPCAASRSTADGIADYIERVVTRFLADRDAAADETFAEWAHRAEEEALQ